MSNRTVGREHEKRVAKYLESQGYLIERGFMRAAFVKGRIMPIGRDLFGAFDILAIRDGDTTSGLEPQVRFIQVTTGGVAPRKAKAFSIWRDSEVWEHIKSTIYRIHRSDGTEEGLSIKSALTSPKSNGMISEPADG